MGYALSEPKRSGNAWLSLTTHGSGMALYYGAKPRKRIEARINGYEMQANAMAPLNSASHRHCWEKRRHGQEAMGCEWLGQSGATFCTATAKNSNRKIHF